MYNILNSIFDIRYLILLPLQVDCAIFGHLSQIAFVDFPYAHKDLLNMECSNLRHYLYRIREKLWPDWFIRSDPGEFAQ